MLTPKQQRLIAALLAAPTVRKACERAGCSERSWRAWKGGPEFRAALARARDEAMAEAVGQLKGVMPAAVRALSRGLRSKDRRVGVRAAKAVFDVGFKAAELLDLAERVEALEQARELGPADADGDAPAEAVPEGANGDGRLP
jgi:hypothetical protein